MTRRRLQALLALACGFWLACSLVFLISCAAFRARVAPLFPLIGLAPAALLAYAFQLRLVYLRLLDDVRAQVGGASHELAAYARGISDGTGSPGHLAAQVAARLDQLETQCSVIGVPDQQALRGIIERVRRLPGRAPFEGSDVRQPRSAENIAECRALVEGVAADLVRWMVAGYRA